jgi:antitoxin component YwqK of YwqJK toxin-antitoxin module
MRFLREGLGLGGQIFIGLVFAGFLDRFFDGNGIFTRTDARVWVAVVMVVNRWVRLDSQVEQNVPVVHCWLWGIQIQIILRAAQKNSNADPINPFEKKSNPTTSNFQIKKMEHSLHRASSFLTINSLKSDEVTQIHPKTNDVIYIGQVNYLGKRHGPGSLFDPKSGFCIYSGNWDNDHYSDTDGSMYNTGTGQLSYKGGFKNSSRDGEGTLFNQEEYERNYFIWSETTLNFSADQLLLSVPSALQEPALTFWSKGALRFKGFYDSAFCQTGRCASYYYNGMIEKEGFYLNNLEEDTEFQISRMFGGYLYIGGMKQGAYDGYGELFAKKGRLEYKGFFKNGKPCGDVVTLFNSKGKIEYQGGMEDGMKNGPGKWYHFNGRIKCEGEF